MSSLRLGHMTILGCALLLFSVGCKSEPKPMTAERWREDLRYLDEQLLRRHADPFASMGEADFKAAVAQLDARIPSMSDAAVQVEMGRLVAMLHDGHTELWLPREGLGFRNYPFFLYNYNGELTVRIATKPFEHLLGAVIVAIENRPIQEIMDAVEPLIARDNDVELLLSVPDYIGIPEILFGLGLVSSADAATFTLKQDGETFDVELHAIGPQEAAPTEWVRASDGTDPPLWAQQRSRYYWFEYLADSRTLYVKYNRCENQKGRPSIQKFSHELFGVFDAKPVDRLVFDLRNNRGGNYFKSEPFVDGALERAQQLGPGKLFVITGRETFSAGMVTSLQFKQRAHAVLAGEPGRSNPNGSENFEWFHLPNSKLRVDYTDKTRMRAPEYRDSDVLPVDLPVSNSFDDYRNGRDRVLEAVLAWSEIVD